MGTPLYLITGAAGGNGGISRQVIEQLRESGQRVRAFVHHDDARADALRELGAEVALGDLTDLAASSLQWPALTACSVRWVSHRTTSPPRP